MPPSTYDLGTWDLDVEGNYAARQPFIHRTRNGGSTNTQLDLRGPFVGASLPAVPLVEREPAAPCGADPVGRLCIQWIA